MNSEIPAATRIRVAVGGLTLAVLVAIACASSGVNQGDFNLISYQEEWALGQQLEGDIARQMPLVNDRTSLAYVNRIGQRLVAQTELGQRGSARDPPREVDRASRIPERTSHACRPDTAAGPRSSD